MAEYGLPFQWKGNGISHKEIDLEKFRQWASESDPKILAGIPRKRLAEVLIDDAVIDAIANCTPKKGRGRAIVIQLVATKKEFKSLKVAAASCFVSYSALINARLKALKSGHTRFETCGYTFEILMAKPKVVATF